MVIACLICFGILILGLGVLFGLYGEKSNTKGVIICGSLMLSLVAFCLTLLNLSSFASAVAIFFPLALTSIAVSELIFFANIEERTKKLIQSLFFDIALALFTVGIIVLGEFNFLGLLCGELAGLCIGLLFWGIQKTRDKLEIVSSIVGYLLVGMMLGGGVWNVICGAHLTTAIITLVASIMILASMILKTFGEKNEGVRLARRIVLIVALATLTFGVYFF